MSSVEYLSLPELLNLFQNATNCVLLVCQGPCDCHDAILMRRLCFAITNDLDLCTKRFSSQLSDHAASLSKASVTLADEFTDELVRYEDAKMLASLLGFVVVET